MSISFYFWECVSYFNTYLNYCIDNIQLLIKICYNLNWHLKIKIFLWNSLLSVQHFAVSTPSWDLLGYIYPMIGKVNIIITLSKSLPENFYLDFFILQHNFIMIISYRALGFGSSSGQHLMRKTVNLKCMWR